MGRSKSKGRAKKKRSRVSDTVFNMAIFPLSAVFLSAVKLLPYPVPQSPIFGICVIGCYALSYLYMVATEKISPAAIVTFSLASCVVVMLGSSKITFSFLLSVPFLRFFALRKFTTFRQEDLAKHLVTWTSCLWMILFLVESFFPTALIEIPYEVWLMVIVGIVGVHLLPDF